MRSVLQDNSDDDSCSGSISSVIYSDESIIDDEDDNDDEDGDVSIEMDLQQHPPINNEAVPPPWGNKRKAKQLIWKELDNTESSIYLMTVEQIHLKWAPLYPLKRFKVNFEAMKTQKRPYNEQDDGVEPWKTKSSSSRAHDLLFQLYMERETTKVDRMTAEEIKASHDCFEPYDILMNNAAWN